jgi:VanZ family protein
VQKSIILDQVATVIALHAYSWSSRSFDRINKKTSKRLNGRWAAPKSGKPVDKKSSAAGTKWLEDRMIARLARAMAWLYAVALTFLTLGSPSVRPETAMPQYLEHLAAFGVSGLLFSMAYRSRRSLVLLAGVGFTTVLEVFQIWAPGRHARWIDLTMNAAGFCIGVCVGPVVSRSASHL